jgi:hypothetical protein
MFLTLSYPSKHIYNEYNCSDYIYRSNHPISFWDIALPTTTIGVSGLILYNSWHQHTPISPWCIFNNYLPADNNMIDFVGKLFCLVGNLIRLTGQTIVLTSSTPTPP